MSKIRLFVCSWHRKSCSEAERFAVPTGAQEVYKNPPQRRSPVLSFQRFFRLPLPWVMVVFPLWLMGLFMCLDSFSTSIRLTNCSIVIAS